MEGKCIFKQIYQGKTSYGKALEDNAFKAMECKDDIAKGNV
jgi:hypothetical protein